MTDAHARTETLALTVVGLACALVSSAAFWLHMLGWVKMPFFVNVIGWPSIVLMLIMGLFSWQRKLSFWKRFRAGIVGGAAALLAYDGIRFGIYSLNIFEFYPFQSHRIFGYLITGQPASSQAAAISGWLYHFWNGFSFAVIYALIAGPARWYWGWVWAMVLETAMLFTYPTLLDIGLNAGFVAVSLIGHTAFGVALGLTVSRMVREGE
jgi:hypothetical protein